MKTKNGRLSRIAAGCIAMVMTLGGMADAVSADDFYGIDITPVEINETTFPDPVFRQYVSEAFDTDRNGTLSAMEIGYARNIWVQDMGVTDLTGMEYLVELRGLYCQNSLPTGRNHITSLDISKNQELTGVWCSNNPIGTLDLTKNEKLEWVYCFNCGLTELDLTKSPNMSYVECNDNDLGELDVSQNPVLEHLICNYCELEELDLSHNPNMQHLDAIGNKFKKLDLSVCPKMKRLDIWDMPQLGYLDITDLTGLQYYNCAKTGISELDVSFLPHLQKLICSYNSIKELDLSNNHELNCLYCEDNGLEKIDISGCPQLRYFQAGLNKFSKLEIGGCPYLVKTYQEAERQPEFLGQTDVRVGQSWTIDYGGDDSTGGDSKFYIWINDGVDITMNAKAQFPVEEKYSDLDSGVSDNDLMTREQVVQFLYEQAGSPAVSGKSRFNDVKAGSWYEDAVIWGENNALCMGYPYFLADEFGVGKQITRQDLMFMLMRYSEAMHLERSIDFGRSDDYEDYYDIDYDHWEAVTWCATWHIIEGKGAPGSDKSEQKIDPYGRVTYADFESAFNNVLELNKIGTKPDYSGLRDRKEVLPKSDSSKPDNSKPESSSVPDSVKPGPGSRPDSNKPGPGSRPDSGTDNKPGKNTARGDVNGDGDINVTDVAVTAAHIKGIKALDDGASKRADVNRDNDVNVTDISVIAAHIKGIKPID